MIGPSLGAMSALELTGLRKQFGPKAAVQDVTLTVPPGSFFGLVGPNGAGKTTSLSMAVGLLRPDAGQARIFGRDVWADPVAARSLVGVLPDGLALPERLTGRELLTHLGRLRGLDAATAGDRAGELLEILELDTAERTLVIDYSTGMRKKIGLATALLHGPRLLVLDEPFEAVDPVSALTIRHLLREFVGGGGAVVALQPRHGPGRAVVRPRRRDRQRPGRRGRDAGRGPRGRQPRGPVRRARRGGRRPAEGALVVGVLIGMKLRVLRNSLTGTRATGMVLGGLAGLLLAVGTIVLAAAGPIAPCRCRWCWPWCCPGS